MKLKVRIARIKKLNCVIYKEDGVIKEGTEDDAENATIEGMSLEEAFAYLSEKNVQDIDEDTEKVE